MVANNEVQPVLALRGEIPQNLEVALMLVDDELGQGRHFIDAAPHICALALAGCRRLPEFQEVPDDNEVSTLVALLRNLIDESLQGLRPPKILCGIPLAVLTLANTKMQVADKN